VGASVDARLKNPVAEEARRPIRQVRYASSYT
jgi:hypothetical protein